MQPHDTPDIVCPSHTNIVITSNVNATLTDYRWGTRNNWGDSANVWPGTPIIIGGTPLMFGGVPGQTSAGPTKYQLGTAPNINSRVPRKRFHRVTCRILKPPAGAKSNPAIRLPSQQSLSRFLTALTPFRL